MERKTGESYTSCTIPVFPPLVPYGTTFPPQAGALQGSAKPCTHKSLYFKHGLFCHRLRGKSGVAGKGEASAASQSAEWLFCHMMQIS